MSQPRTDSPPAEAQRERASDAGRAIALSAGLLLALYLGLTLAYRDSIPLFEAPDEPAHLHYAAFVYSQGRLPRERPPEVPGTGLQPPLVYLVAAPFLAASGLDVAGILPDLRRAGLATYGPGPPPAGSRRIALVRGGQRHFASDGSLAGLRVLRSTGLAFGLLAVSIAFAAVWRLSRDVRLSLLAGSLLAFNPQFLFTSATFSNDAAAVALGAAALWLVTRVIESHEPTRRHYVAAAGLVLLGLVTKLTALPSLCVAAITIAAVDQRPRAQRNVDVALATGLVVLVSGVHLLGSVDHRGGLLGADLALASAAGRALPEYAHAHALPYLTSVYGYETFESYWARFGWLDLRAPKSVGLACFALTWTGVLGYLTGRVPEPSALLRSRALRAYLLASVGVTLASHLAINLAVALPQGRLLLPVAPQIALLLALGLTRLLAHEGRMLPLVVGVITTLLVLDLYCLRGMLAAAY